MEKIYQPEHPLPDEIRTMLRSETICQFCGVSYLIHSEIKRLQYELEECKKEIKRLKDFDTREIFLENDIKQLNLQIKDLKSKYESVEKTSQQQSLLLNSKESETSHLKDKLKSFSKMSEEAILNLLSFKNQIVWSMQCLQDVLKKMKIVYCILVLNVKDLPNELSAFMQELKLKLIAEEIKRSDLISYLNSSNQKLKAENLIIQKETNEKLVEMEKIFNKEMLKKINLLEEEKVKEIQFLEEKHRYQMGNVGGNSNLTPELRKYKILLESRGMTKLEVAKIEKKDKTEKDLTNVIHQMKIDHLESKSLSDELLSAKTVVQQLCSKVDQLKKEQEVLSNAYKDLEGENKALKAEREKSILAYQYKLGQMQESLDEKIIDSEKSKEQIEQLKKRLQELKEENQRHVEELINAQNNLKMEMDDQHKKTISDLNESYLKREQKLKFEMDSMQDKFHSKVKMLLEKADVAQKEKAFAISALTDKLIKSQLLYEESVKNVVYKNLSTESEDSYKKKIQDLQNLLTVTQSDFKKNCILLQDSMNEIESLRDCVKRECEERFELTEALSAARAELLSSQSEQKSSVLCPTRSSVKPMTKNFTLDLEKSNRMLTNGGQRNSKQSGR